MYARMSVESVCKGMMVLTGVIRRRRRKSLLILRIVSSLEILWLQRMSIYSSGDREIVNSIPKSKFPTLCLPISYPFTCKMAKFDHFGYFELLNFHGQKSQFRVFGSSDFFSCKKFHHFQKIFSNFHPRNCQN
jgi:hypothetical protein